MTAAILATPGVVVPPPAPDSPDADLIRLCAEYVALSIERDRILLASADAPFVAVVSRLAELAPAIAALPARTDEGVRAKAAAVMRRTAADGDPGKPRQQDDAPAHSLAVDLLRPRPVLALGSPHPDAALLALHDRFIASQLRVRELSRIHLRDDKAFEAACEPLYAKQRAMVEEAEGLHATTLAGVRARVRMWLAEAPDAIPATPEPGINLHEHLQLQVLRDLCSNEEIAGFRNPSDLPGYKRAVATAVRQEVHVAASPSPWAAVADRLEQLEIELHRIDVDAEATDGEMMPPLREWWATAKTVPGYAVATTADVIALARICRATWTRSQGDDCDLRDALDQKLHEAVIAQAAVPGSTPDAALIALCARHDDAYGRWLQVFRDADVQGLDDDTADAIRDPIGIEMDELREQIIASPVRTADGARAIARTWRRWNDNLSGGNDLERDARLEPAVNTELAWKLLQALTEPAQVTA